MSNNSSPEEEVGTNSAGMLLETLATPAAPGPAPSITIDGIEVVQAVQDMNHTVTLVADKATVVRVYLSTAGSAPLTVRGTLAARRAGTGAWTQLPSTANVVLNPADAGPSGLRRKRETLGLSLNFLLPSSLRVAGDLEVALSRVERVNPVVPLAVPAGATRRVTFRRTPTLRVHVIGIRYQTTQADGSVRSHEPAAIDYALIRSWLGRAYPVARIEWAQTVIDWHGQKAWPTDDDVLGVWGKDEVNPYVSSLRTQDVAAGTDHRTHYFGLAADSGGFMRGWATTPSTPDPSAVGSGPAGVPAGSFGWDTDGSYGDWYTGHELAHTFGRQHPGFCNGNSKDDQNFPYPNGQIAHNDGDFVGYDAGDPARGIAPQALPGTVWHDLMTYCVRQWVSRYTYEGIYRRLIAEEDLAAGAPLSGGPPSTVNPATGGGAMPSQPEGIHVVARVNETEGTGEFRFVTPVAGVVNAGQAPAPAGEYAIRVTRGDGTTDVYPAVFRLDVGGDTSDPDASVTGSLDVIIPNAATAVTLELIRNEAVLATYTPGAEPPEPEDIRAAPPTSGPTFMTMDSARASARPKIMWSSAGAAGPQPAGALVEESNLKYTVQVSTDDGGSWRTIGVGLVTPEVTIDPHLLEGKETVRVRVTATNGFKTKTTTQTLAVKDM